MRRDVIDLREFYAAPIGKAAREMVARKVGAPDHEVFGAVRAAKDAFRG